MALSESSFQLPKNTLFNAAVLWTLLPQNHTPVKLPDVVESQEILVIGDSAGRALDDSCVDRRIAVNIGDSGRFSVEPRFLTTQQWLLDWPAEKFDCSAPPSTESVPRLTTSDSTVVSPPDEETSSETKLTGFGYFAIGFGVAGMLVSGICCFILYQQKQRMANGYHRLAQA